MIIRGNNLKTNIKK